MYPLLKVKAFNLHIPRPVRLLLAGLLFLAGVCAQDRTDAGHFKGSVRGPKVWYFKLDRYDLLAAYRGNASMFAALDSLLGNPCIAEHIDTVYITATASPIGRAFYNRSLSFRRGAAMRKYIEARLDIAPGRYVVRPVGVDWEGFRAIVTRDTDFPGREEILSLINRGRDEDGTLWLLRSVGGAAVQKRLIQETYPLLQYVSVRLRLTDGSYIHPLDGSPLRQLIEGKDIDAEQEMPEPEGLPGTPVAVPPDSVISAIITALIPDTALSDTTARDSVRAYPAFPAAAAPGGKHGLRLYAALKTNLLYDAALLPNLTFEAYLGRGWSLAVEGNWSWWVFGSPAPERAYHRIQAAGLEIRKWTGSPRPLQGHAAGLYVLGGTYDIRLAAKDEFSRGWLSNRSWSAGISYGYSMPVGHRLSLELGIAAGYLGGTYYDYDYCADHRLWRWLATKKRNYWGITRAGVSLVWRFCD